MRKAANRRVGLIGGKDRTLQNALTCMGYFIGNSDSLRPFLSTRVHHSAALWVLLLCLVGPQSLEPPNSALVVYNLSNCKTVHRFYLASGLLFDYLPGVVLFVYLPGVLLYNPLSWPVFHLRAETGYSDRFVSFAQGTP